MGCNGMEWEKGGRGRKGEEERHSRSKDGPGDGDESAIELGLAIRGRDDVVRRQEGDFRAGGDIAIGGCRYEHWEGLITDRISDKFILVSFML